MATACSNGEEVALIKTSFDAEEVFFLAHWSWARGLSGAEAAPARAPVHASASPLWTSSRSRKEEDLVGACERQARGFLGGALRCLACSERGRFF
jgi:hypothetical protein